MKKIILSLTLIAALTSCNGTKSLTDSAGTAASLLSSLSPDSKLADIANLFTMLDVNSDKSISSSEAIGQIADNFGVLDTNKSSGIDLSELGGLLSLLK